MKYTEFKELVVKKAKEAQLSEYELYYMESEDISAEALMHELTKFSTEDNRGACFRCIYEGKMGYASTELFSREEAQRLVLDAMENAAVIESEDKVFIYDGADNYEKIEEKETTVPQAKDLVNLCLTLEKGFFEQDERVLEGSMAGVGYGKVKVALCNSKGLDLSHSYNYSQLAAVVSVKEGEEVYNGYKVVTGDFNNFNVDLLAQETVDKVVKTIGADTVESGTYDLIFSSEMMATMLSTFFTAFSADAARRGLSLLKGKEGEQVASAKVTILDDPFYSESFIKMPFDGEGVATYRKKVIEEGKLITLLHNLTTAYEAGVASTGNGRKLNYSSGVNVLPYNFLLAAGEAGEKEEVFKAVGKGIYITALNGLHAGANPATGDFSLSAEGFLVEEGEQKRPVKNFTVSGNFYELLQKITLVGSDVKLNNPEGGVCYGAPTTVVKEISVAGK